MGKTDSTVLAFRIVTSLGKKHAEVSGVGGGTQVGSWQCSTSWWWLHGSIYFEIKSWYYTLMIFCHLLYELDFIKKKLKGGKKQWTTILHVRLTKRSDSINYLRMWNNQNILPSCWQCKLVWTLRKTIWHYLTYFIIFKMKCFLHLNTSDIEMHLAVTNRQQECLMCTWFFFLMAQ